MATALDVQHVGPVRAVALAALVCGALLGGLGAGSAEDVLGVPNVEILQVLGDGGGQLDQFGYSVDIDADTAIVGAPWEDEGRGAAYLFVRAGDTWVKHARVTAPTHIRQVDSFFGWSVAIDGPVAVIGAKWLDPGHPEATGAAYVIRASGGEWSTSPKILVPDSDAYFSEFGAAVAVHGNLIVVGAPEFSGPASGEGAAYVFAWDGVQWARLQRLERSDGGGVGSFGSAVAVHDETIMVGSPAGDGTASSSGVVHVFDRSGGVWVHEAAVSPEGASSGDRFGVAVAAEAGRMVVGASRDDHNGADAGAAYIFAREGDAFSEEAVLRAADGAAGDGFGSSVALRGDVVLVGAPSDDDHGVDSGSAYTFGRGETLWAEHGKILASAAGADDRFGMSVGLSSDAAIIGVPDDAHAGSSAGSAYLVVADLDEDGLTDAQEAAHGTDPHIPDTDADGLLDGAEVWTVGTDPLLSDTDADLLSDGDEVLIHGTDPLVADTDGDGLLDGDEVLIFGSDPLVPDGSDEPSGLLRRYHAAAHRDGSGNSGLELREIVSGTFVAHDGGTADAVLLEDGPAPSLLFRGASYPMDLGVLSGSSFTLVLTARPDGSGFDNMVLGGSGGELNRNLHVGFRSATVHMGFYLNDVAAPISLDAERVYTLAFRYDVDTGERAIIVDGLVRAHDEGVAPLVANEGARLGAYGSHAVFDGSLYQLAVFGRALTCDELVTMQARFSANAAVPLALEAGDQDGDGIGNGCDPDVDGDGLSNSDEVMLFATDPYDPDSDADGLSDGAEVTLHGTDPLDPDSDADALLDGEEVLTYGTDPLDADTDDDDLEDGDEVMAYGTDPLDPDSDADGLLDGHEVYQYGTDPLVYDTDGDGQGDGYEVQGGSDPTDAGSYVLPVVGPVTTPIPAPTPIPEW